MEGRGDTTQVGYTRGHIWLHKWDMYSEWSPFDMRQKILPQVSSRSTGRSITNSIGGSHMGFIENKRKLFAKWNEVNVWSEAAEGLDAESSGCETAGAKRVMHKKELSGKWS